MSFVQFIDVNKIFYDKFGKESGGLKNINLAIEEGEVVGVIGTNGAGKSTLLDSITGRIPIDSGEIWINNQRIDQKNQIELSATVGRVYQNSAMGTAPRMTVFENLMIACKRGKKRGLTKSLTQDNYNYYRNYLMQFNLNLENLLNTPIDSLSGGQRQVISLIMATLNKPKLLLLDEHTAALDPRTSKQVMTLTESIIKEKNLTTLMVTHQLNDAINYCDRIIIMHLGEIKTIINHAQIQRMNSQELFRILEEIQEAEYITQ